MVWNCVNIVRAEKESFESEKGKEEPKRGENRRQSRGNLSLLHRQQKQHKSKKQESDVQFCQMSHQRKIGLCENDLFRLFFCTHKTAKIKKHEMSLKKVK